MVVLLELQILLVVFISIAAAFITDEKTKKWVVKILAIPLIPLAIVDLIELLMYLKQFF